MSDVEEFDEAEEELYRRMDEGESPDDIALELYLASRRGEEINEDLLALAAQACVILQFMKSGIDYDTAVKQVTGRDSEVVFSLDSEGMFSIKLKFDD